MAKSKAKVQPLRGNKIVAEASKQGKGKAQSKASGKKR
jgi:hypothetical protein